VFICRLDFRVCTRIVLNIHIINYNANYRNVTFWKFDMNICEAMFIIPIKKVLKESIITNRIAHSFAYCKTLSISVTVSTLIRELNWKKVFAVVLIEYKKIVWYVSSWKLIYKAMKESSKCILFYWICKVKVIILFESDIINN